MDSIAYIGLGANLGNPCESLRAAMVALGELPLSQLLAKSSLYASAPIDAEGDDYLNAVVKLQTQLSSSALLTELQKLEQHFGRVRSYQNAPRTLDLDLLLFDQEICTTKQLQLPHPRMHQRAFVLLPLLEITPEITLPNLGFARPLLLKLSNQVIQKMTE